MAAEIRRKHSMHEYALFAEAWFFLAVSRILIFFVPFKKLLPILGRQLNNTEAEKAASKPGTSPVFLKMIQISILRAASRSPWRTKCFEQALAARMMLKKRKMESVIYFGLNKNLFNAQKEESAAHAWIVCSGFTITGGRNNKMFTIVGRFAV